MRRYSELLRARAAPLWPYLAAPFRWLRNGFAVVGLVVCLVLFGVGIYAWSFWHGLPDFDHIDARALRQQAEKRVAQRLGGHVGNQRWTDIGRVNRGCLYAIVASEDATFFEHDGFNFEAILDSLAENLKRRETAYGASTITQQTAKNLYLDSEKTLVRKARELLITQGLERRFSKNEILEVYLNVAEFGPDIYGIDAAGRHFFGKAPDALNAAEGAFLALMLPSPRRHYFTIWQNKNLTRVKRRRLERVLRDMLYEEYLTEAQYREYVRYSFFPVDAATDHRKPATLRRR